MLDEFAYEVNLNTEELLESTNGLWLLGKHWLNADNASCVHRCKSCLLPCAFIWAYMHPLHFTCRSMKFNNLRAARQYVHPLHLH